MQLIEVESSMIYAVGYDEPTQTMAVAVAFDSGRIYHYLGVPREAYEGLLAAESKGRYMRFPGSLFVTGHDRLPYNGYQGSLRPLSAPASASG